MSEAVSPAIPDAHALAAREELECARMRDSVAKRSRLTRKARGLTLAKLAELAHCSPSMLSTIEGGKHLPSVPVLARLAAALGVEVGWLIGDDGDGRGSAGGPPAIQGEGLSSDRAGPVVRVLGAHTNLTTTVDAVTVGGGEGATLLSPGRSVAGLVMAGALQVSTPTSSATIAAGECFMVSGDEALILRSAPGSDATVLTVSG